MVNTIGTEHESSLHNALKIRYAGAGGRIEAAVGGFVADGLSASGELIEVQLGSFGSFKQKVRELAARRRIRIIHPVIVTRYIEVFEPQKRGKTRAASSASGKLLYRRKSPRKGSPWDLFDALVHAPELPLIPGLRIELALVDIIEKRLKDGKGSWRRKGVSIQDRELAAWHTSIPLKKPKDYLRFAPFARDEEFTTSLLAGRAGIKARLARKTLYVLTRLGIVKRVGKQGNSIVYAIETARKQPAARPPAAALPAHKKPRHK
jgi:hypothetical protein